VGRSEDKVVTWSWTHPAPDAWPPQAAAPVSIASLFFVSLLPSLRPRHRGVGAAVVVLATTHPTILGECGHRQDRVAGAYYPD
jgi:hypothetical protein